MSIKVVCISDTHLQHNFDIPSGDILLHAGDLTWVGSVEELSKVNQWFGELKSKFADIVTIAGNHDKLFEQNSSLARSLITNAIYLEDSEVVVQGLRIYGSPYQPSFGQGWAFNKDRGSDIKCVWDKIPEGLDFLITHGPPYGKGDIVLEGDGDSWETGNDLRYVKKHVGCRNLRNQITKVQPKYHMFGHVHCGYGLYEEVPTTYINASVCNEQYKPVNAPIVITL